MRAWNLTLEDEQGNRIPPGLPMLASARPDSQPNELTPVAVVVDPVNPGRASLQFDNVPNQGGAYTIDLYVKGYASMSFRCDLPNIGSAEIHGVPPHPGVDPFPLPRLEPSIAPFPFPPVDFSRAPYAPPFDQPEPPGYEDVHTVLPPEALALPAIANTEADLNYWRGDAWGCTTPEPQLMLGDGSPDYASMQALGLNTNNGGCTWTTYLLHLLPMQRQDYFLDFYRTQRCYTDILLQEQGNFDAFADCAQHAKSRGLWRTFVDYDYDAIERAVLGGLCEKVLIGFEVNLHMSPEDCEALIYRVGNLCNPLGIPVWIEFSSNYRSYQPDGTSAEDWARRVRPYLTGLFWESRQNADYEDNAGQMGAHLWDARWWWARIDPTFLVAAGEIMSMRQFYGPGPLGAAAWCIESRGNLRGWEMICCTRGPQAPDAPPVAGCCNGPGSRPNGTVL